MKKRLIILLSILISNYTLQAIDFSDSNYGKVMDICRSYINSAAIEKKQDISDTPEKKLEEFLKLTPLEVLNYNKCDHEIDINIPPLFITILQYANTEDIIKSIFLEKLPPNIKINILSKCVIFKINPDNPADVLLFEKAVNTISKEQNLSDYDKSELETFKRFILVARTDTFSDYRPNDIENPVVISLIRNGNIKKALIIISKSDNSYSQIRRLSKILMVGKTLSNIESEMILKIIKKIKSSDYYMAIRLVPIYMRLGKNDEAEKIIDNMMKEFYEPYHINIFIPIRFYTEMGSYEKALEILAKGENISQESPLRIISGYESEHLPQWCSDSENLYLRSKMNAFCFFMAYKKLKKETESLKFENEAMNLSDASARVRNYLLLYYILESDRNKTVDITHKLIKIYHENPGETVFPKERTEAVFSSVFLSLLNDSQFTLIAELLSSKKNNDINKEAVLAFMISYYASADKISPEQNLEIINLLKPIINQ